MEYKVFSMTDHHEVARVVNTYLRKGWHLYGPLSVITPGAQEPSQKPVFSQAMIKQVKESDKPDLKAV